MGVFEPAGVLGEAAIAAAHELGVVEAIAGGARTADAIAAAIGVRDGHRLRALLDALVALGAVARDGAAYAPGAVPEAAAGLAGDGWGALADVIRRDRPVAIDPGVAARYHAHLVAAGAPAAREVALVLGASELLDLGGGAGAYTEAFLDAADDARAVLVDDAAVLALAAAHLARFGDRVRLVAGDARDAPAGGGHAAVLLANVLHLHPPGVCAELCAAAARAAAPGGTVAVVDLRIDDGRAGPRAGVLFALNMAIYTDGGGVYEPAQIRGWLEAAGLIEVEVRALAAAPEMVAVLGRRPGPLDDALAAAGAAAWAALAAAGALRDDARDAGPPRLAFPRPLRRALERALADEARDDRTGAPPGAEAAALPHARRDHADEARAHQTDAPPGTEADALPHARRDHADDARDRSTGAPPGTDAAALPHARRDHADEARDRPTGAPPGTEAAALPHARRDLVAGALVRHYADAMPRARVALLAGRDGPAAALLHHRLDWARLPRLARAIDRLCAILDEAGVPPEAGLGARDAAALAASTPTLAALYARTHYGALMPLLYGGAADLARFEARASERGLDRDAAIDRYLTAPIVHELAHLAPARDALVPIHLDECLAGWLGVHAHPELAYPAPGEDDAIFAAPWLSQIGQAIARALGVRAAVRAHAGVEPPPPAFATAAARLGWADWRARRTLHFLSDTLDPDPWVGLALAAGAGRPLAGETLTSLARLPAAAFAALPADDAFDRAIVEDALRAMCLANARAGGTFVARARAPAEPIAIDAIAGRVTTARTGDADAAPPRYWLPPAVCARLAAAGLAAAELHLGDLAAIPAAAAALCGGAAPEVERPGFRLRARTAAGAG